MSEARPQVAELASSAGTKRPREHHSIVDYEPEYKRFKECVTRANELKLAYEFACYELDEASVGLPKCLTVIWNTPNIAISYVHETGQ